MARSFADRSTGRLGGTRQTLQHLVHDLGGEVTGEQLDVAKEAHLRAARLLQTPRREAARVLDRLRGAGLRLGVLSDCSSELPELWSGSDIAGRVDAVGFSWRSGLRKPDPRAYLAVTEALGVEPADCWYVGDGGSQEIAGAERLGMTTVLVLNTGYDVAHLRYDADDQEPHAIVDDLDGVIDVVLGR